MTTIYLIRHAEAEGNLYRRAHGWYNSTITDRGYRQIAALTKRFTDTKFDAVYSSDRFRTMITALAIYKTHGLPLRTVRALREIDVGYWEDTPWAELERIDPEQLAYFSNDSQKWHVDGCESFAEVRERMRKALTEIAEAHPNGTAAVFSHGMKRARSMSSSATTPPTSATTLPPCASSLGSTTRKASRAASTTALRAKRGISTSCTARRSSARSALSPAATVWARSANSGSRRTRRSAASAKSSSVRLSPMRARAAAPSSRPAASRRAIWSASTARKCGASTPSARTRKAGSYRKMKKKKIEKACLPVSKDEMVERGWYYYDFLVVTADAYIDHPSFGTAIIARVLEHEGYRVAVLAQPDWHSADAFRAMGRPRYGVMIGGGNIDSMVAHYTAAKKRRTQDLYSPGSRMGLRPDRPTIVYANRCREAFGNIPIVVGGLEASLRRFAHYDYWDDKVRRALIFDAQADLLV